MAAAVAAVAADLGVAFGADAESASNEEGRCRGVDVDGGAREVEAVAAACDAGEGVDAAIDDEEGDSSNILEHFLTTSFGLAFIAGLRAGVDVVVDCEEAGESPWQLSFDSLLDGSMVCCVLCVDESRESS